MVTGDNGRVPVLFIISEFSWMLLSEGEFEDDEEEEEEMKDRRSGVDDDVEDDVGNVIGSNDVNLGAKTPN